MLEFHRGDASAPSAEDFLGIARELSPEKLTVIGPRSHLLNPRDPPHSKLPRNPHAAEHRASCLTWLCMIPERDLPLLFLLSECSILCADLRSRDRFPAHTGRAHPGARRRREQASSALVRLTHRLSPVLNAILLAALPRPDWRCHDRGHLG